MWKKIFAGQILSTVGDALKDTHLVVCYAQLPSTNPVYNSTWATLQDNQTIKHRVWNDNNFWPLSLSLCVFPLFLRVCFFTWLKYRQLAEVCPLSQVAKLIVKLIVSHIKDHITYSTHVDQGKKTKTINKKCTEEDSLPYNGRGQTGRRSEGGKHYKKTKVLECAINGAARMWNQPPFSFFLSCFLCLCLCLACVEQHTCKKCR